MVAGEEAIRQFLSFYTTESDIWKSPFFFSPTLLLLYVAIICLYSSYKAPNQSDNTPNTKSRKSKLLFKLVFFFSCLISLTLLTDIMVIFTRLMKEKMLIPVLGYYSSMTFLIWISNTYYLMKKANQSSIWQTFQSSFYGLAIIGETLIGWLWLMAMMQSGKGSILSVYDKCLLSTFTIRYALEISITLFSVIRKFTNKNRDEEDQSETSHLISSSTRTETYGSTIITTTTVYSSDNSITTKLLTTLPFIWPDDNFELQARLIICIFLMLAGVAINVLTPIQVGYVVDHLEGGSGKFAWAAVLAYAGLRYFQGGAGILKTIQNQTWEPVEEHLLTEISNELKEYLKRLSPEERAYMKMDEAQKTIFKGAKCIIQLLSQVSFHIFPLLATMVVSITVLGAGYTFLGGLIVFITMATYTYLTIVITEKQNAKNGQNKSSAALGLTQNSIISTGVLVGSLWYAWQISRNKLTSGDFVVFNMYIIQLGTPLRFLGNYYQMTQKSFKDLGNMSMLFTNKETSTNIQEVNGPPTTDSDDAHIVFDRVKFGYDGEREIFKSLSFNVKRDAFVAVVGPSGCGKSTLMRLIFRFYDPLSGKIYVNGQDSKTMEHSTLRQNIGFIPQSTILFNDTVLYNIRHGNIDASDEDIFYAAQVAQVHNQILKFPQGYATKLGERGYKISDSVKQRIAIARAVLKNPNLLLLDESTSALGAEREKSIQKALADFSDNCTVFFATRRLSSIVNADVILVMKDGQLMECGTHKELLERASRDNTSSLYSSMWQKQMESSNSTCQDSKNDNTIRIIEDCKSELGQPISHNTEAGESSSSNKNYGYGSRTSEIPVSVKLSNSKISESCTTSFPAFTGSSITTYTDFNVSKTSQFSIPIPGKSNLFGKYDYSYKNHANITDEINNPPRPAKPLLLEPSSSLRSSNPGELIIPKLLESGLNIFDTLITLESGECRPPSTIRCTTTDRTIHNNATADSLSYSTDTASNDSSPKNTYTGNTSKLVLKEHYGNIKSEIYNYSQFTMPTSAKPKFRHITSNAAEFILPIFSESSLKKFNNRGADKLKTKLISEETTYTDTSLQLPEASITNNTQYLSQKESEGNTNNISEVDSYSKNLQDIPTSIQLTKSESTAPTPNIIASKHSEIIVPEFSYTTFRRLDKVIVNTTTNNSLSKTQVATLSKTNKALPSHPVNIQKYNNKEKANSNICDDVYRTIQLVTPESKEPASSSITSHPAELIAPRFSDAKLKQISKATENEPYAPLSSENIRCSTMDSHMNDTEMTSNSQKYQHDKYTNNPNLLLNSCDPIQLTVPYPARTQQSVISSNAAELVIPRFPKSTITKFTKDNYNNINQPNTDSTSREITTTRIIDSKTHISSLYDIQQERLVEYSDQKNDIIKRNSQTENPSIMKGSIQLSKQELKTSDHYQKSSNPAELIIPIFSLSYLKRFSNIGASDHDVPSSSTLPKMNTSKNGEVIPVNIDIGKGSNSTESDVRTFVSQGSIIRFLLSTPKLKEPTTILTASNNAELVIPLFSKSFERKVNNFKITKSDIVSISELDKNESSIPTSSKFNGPENTNTVSNSRYKGKNVASAEILSTRSMIFKDSPKASSCSNNQENKLKKAAILNTQNEVKYNTKKDTNSKGEAKDLIGTKCITLGSHLSPHSKSTIEMPNESIIPDHNALQLFSNSDPDALDHSTATPHSDFRTDIDVYTYLIAHYPAKSKSEDRVTHMNCNKQNLNISNSPGYTSSSRSKTTNKPPMHIENGQFLESDTPEPVKSRLSHSSVSKVIDVDLNKTATVNKTDNRETPNQKLAKTGVNIVHSTSTEYKKSNGSENIINQLQNLSNEKADIHMQSDSITSVNDNKKKSRNILSKEDDKLTNAQNKSLEMPRVLEPAVHKAASPYKKKNILNSKYEVSHHISSSDSVMSADSKEKKSKETKIEQCQDSGTHTSTVPSTTTVVQLEISKSAEPSTVKFQKNDISNYVKSEQMHSADIPLQKDSKLQRRRVSKLNNSETSRIGSLKPNKNGDDNDCIVEINKRNESLEKNNGQPHDYSSNAQSNRDALQFQTGNRNWRKRLRRAFPASVLTNESFVSANAQLYLPRSSDSSVLDINFLSSISHILHSYENDAVSIIEVDLVAPAMPKDVDASTEIQLIKSDNANFIVPKYNSLNLSKFKHDTGFKSFEKTTEISGKVEIQKDKYNYSEQSTSKAVILNTSSSSIENTSKTYSTRNASQKNCKVQTSSTINNLKDVAISTPTSSLSDVPNTRRFNKAKHIQLYTPLIAKLISLDIAAILSYYISKKLSTTLDSYFAPLSPESVNTDHISTTRETNALTDQNQTEYPVASSSKQINGDKPLRRHCHCKKHREKKYEIVEIPLKAEIIEIILESDIDKTHGRYQIEYVELELESDDDKLDEGRVQDE